PLEDAHPELAEALAEDPAEAWPQAPVLLLGLPGSGVERIAALLADQPQVRMLRDRTSPARDDDFNHPRFAYYCGELDEAAREDMRLRYLAGLDTVSESVDQAADASTAGSSTPDASSAGAPAHDDDRIVIDWLPRWDAHLLALIRRAMPGTRLVIVQSDPRAALLNWLAFGWVPGFPVADIDAAVEWWLRAQRHLEHGADLDEPRRIHVDADRVIAEPILASADLASFLGIAPLQPETEFARSAHSFGGLPTRFEAGHWQRYTDALDSAFARLAT
ncbi:MAG: sulfotransferase, partial [Rhodanobacteraceae bacterium]